jgi:secreted protein with Ig-like and vWFA domain
MTKKTEKRARLSQEKIDTAKMQIIDWKLSNLGVEKKTEITDAIQKTLKMSGRDAINLADILGLQPELPLGDE